jgi:hypothetical protein
MLFCVGKAGAIVECIRGHVRIYYYYCCCCCCTLQVGKGLLCNIQFVDDVRL